MSTDVATAVVSELRRFAQPLLDAAGDPASLRAFIAQIGWDLDAITGLPLDRIGELLGAVADAVETLEATPLPPEDLTALGEVLSAGTAVVDAVTGLGGAFNGALAATPPPGFEQLGADLVELLSVLYLERHRPGALAALELLGIARPVTGDGVLVFDEATGAVVRFPVDRTRLNGAQLTALVSDPVRALKETYAGSTGPVNDSPALARAVFAALDLALLRLYPAGRLVSLDRDLIDPAESGVAGAALEASSAVLTIPLDADVGASFDTDAAVGAVLTLAGSDNGSLGLVITPFGAFDATWAGQRWTVQIGGDVAAGTALVSAERVTFTEPDPQVRLNFALTRGDASGPAVLIGPPEGTRLEIGSVTISGQVDLDAGQVPDVGAELALGAASVAVAAGEGDGFLAKILPPGGFAVDFDLAVGWSTKRGLYLRGAAQLEVHVPVHRTFLGILTLETVDLAIAIPDGPEPAVDVVAAATVSVKLGPVAVSVEQLGLQLRISFPPGGGAAGPAQLEPGFHPPVGAGLAIDAVIVHGGGYLRADHANGRYGGVLQLSIAEVVNATAIGSLVVSPNPANPDAPLNYSLLLILVAEFPPIQLGYGFTLSGLGGILGANRTMSTDALQAGVRNRALDSILFPRDAAANAVRILRDVETVFPPAPGQFVIGLMARIGWGTPRLVTADIGIILELPNPLRIVLLGRLSLALPTEDVAVVKLQLDVVGILDLPAREVSIDATLYDSRLAIFTVSGDMALRLEYGVDPGLALSCGGFNPRFTPPANFPLLERLAIALGTGDNPRLRLEAYIAATANSVQFGARLDFHVAADLGTLGVVSASAHLSFDTLVTLVPFAFVVDLGGAVDIRRNGAVLFSAELRLSISGPQPVRAWGYAQFEFFGRHRIPFDHTFGPDPLDVTLDVQDPARALLRALAEAGNWDSRPPAAAAAVVSLRQLPPPPEGTLLAHPLGELEVRQRVVPLDVPLQRFAGTAVPVGTGSLQVRVDLAGAPAVGELVRDAFPTGETLALTDDEKVSGEQFSFWPCGLSGIRLVDGPTRGGTVVAGIADEYETRLLDPARRTRRPAAAYAVAGELLEGFLARGAAGTGPLRRTGAAAHTGPSLGIAVGPARYRVLRRSDLSVVAGAGGRTDYDSESEAQAALAVARAAGRAADRDLVVAGAHEGTRA